MKIAVIGGGMYGCHISLSLITDGHYVQLFERNNRLFGGASGSNPARLHIGPHYPRSKLTRALCQDNAASFEKIYGQFTRAVPINLYAIAKILSLVDFGTYCGILRPEIEFVTVKDPAEFGLREVEGAILTGERHLVIDEVRAFFTEKLEAEMVLNHKAAPPDDFDAILDCTFSAIDAGAIDRYEPCLTVLLEGPTDKAVTIMDGPFPSLYPWNEAKKLSTLTSAALTPISKTCRTYEDARRVLDTQTVDDINGRVDQMIEQMRAFYPAIEDYDFADGLFGIRAMPKSAADARLVDVVRQSNILRVRAGKIDAIFLAERLVKEALACW